MNKKKTIFTRSALVLFVCIVVAMFTLAIVPMMITKATTEKAIAEIEPEFHYIPPDAHELDFSASGLTDDAVVQLANAEFSGTGTLKSVDNKSPVNGSYLVYDIVNSGENAGKYKVLTYNSSGYGSWVKPANASDSMVSLRTIRSSGYTYSFVMGDIIERPAKAVGEVTYTALYQDDVVVDYFTRTIDSLNQIAEIFEVGNKYYYLEEDITLYSDLDGKGELDTTSDISRAKYSGGLDLNGYTFTASGLYITGNTTIIDSSVGKTGKIVVSSKTAGIDSKNFFGQDMEALHLNGITYEYTYSGNNDNSDTPYAINGTKMNMEITDSTIIANNAYGFHAEDITGVVPKFTMNSGSITAKYNAVYCNGVYSTFYLNGGTLISGAGYANIFLGRRSFLDPGFDKSLTYTITPLPEYGYDDIAGESVYAGRSISNPYEKTTVNYTGYENCFIWDFSGDLSLSCGKFIIDSNTSRQTSNDLYFDIHAHTAKYNKINDTTVEISCDNNDGYCAIQRLTDKKLVVSLNAPDAEYTGTFYEENENVGLIHIPLFKVYTAKIELFSLPISYYNVNQDGSKGGKVSYDKGPIDTGNYIAEVQIGGYTLSKKFAIYPHEYKEIIFYPVYQNETSKLESGYRYLKEDMTITSGITLTDKVVKIDLNGHTLTFTGTGYLYTLNFTSVNKSIAFYDSSKDKTGKIICTNGGFIYNKGHTDGCSLDIYEGYYETTADDATLIAHDVGVTNIEGGTFKASGDNGIALASVVRSIAYDTSELNVSGGEFYGDIALKLVEKLNGLQHINDVTLSGGAFLGTTKAFDIAQNMSVNLAQKCKYKTGATKALAVISTTNVLTGNELYIEVISHIHDFTYSKNDNVVTATCSNSDGECQLTNCKVSVTIASPDNAYSTDGYEGLTITDKDNFESVTDKKFAISYIGRNGTTYTASATAPTAVGKYTVTVTMDTVSVSIDFEITKATPTVSANPTASDIRYNDNLSQSTISGGTTSVAGTFAWKDGTETMTTLGSVSKKVVFTPTDTTNYTTTEFNINVKVEKAYCQTTPQTPVLKSKTDNTIVVESVEDVEFSIDNGTNYTDTPTFTGLDANTTYNIVARFKETTNYLASSNSSALSVKTKSASASAPTLNNIIASRTDKAIEINIVKGVEYIITTSTPADWATATANNYVSASNNGKNTFNDLSPATKYYVSYRTAETDTAMPSETDSVWAYTRPSAPAKGVGYTLTDLINVTVTSGYEIIAKPTDDSEPDWSTPITGSTTLTINTTYLVRLKESGDVPSSIPTEFSTKNMPTITDFTITYPTDSVYSGTAKEVTAQKNETAIGNVTVKYSDDDGTTWTADKPVDVGTYKVRILVEESEGYASASIDLDDIEIAALDISGATVTLDETLTYNGISQEQSVESVIINGLNATFDVSDNIATNAGSYNLTITANGNFTGSIQSEFEIQKADYNMSGITLSDFSVLYDGNPHGIVVSGNLPIGLDNIPVTVSYNTTEVSEVGIYTIIAEFEGSNNYNKPQDISATITIRALTTSKESDGAPTTIVTSQTGFSPIIELVVKTVDKAKNDIVNNFVGKKEEITEVVDIKLLLNGAIYNSLETLTVRLSVPDSVSDEEFVVYNVSANGAFKVEYTMEDGYIVLSTNDLDQLVFVTPKEICFTHWLLLAEFVLFVIYCLITWFVIKRRYFTTKDHKIDWLNVVGFLIYTVSFIVIATRQGCSGCIAMIVLDAFALAIGLFLYAAGSKYDKSRPKKFANSIKEKAIFTYAGAKKETRKWCDKTSKAIKDKYTQTVSEIKSNLKKKDK